MVVCPLKLPRAGMNDKLEIGSVVFGRFPAAIIRSILCSGRGNIQHLGRAWAAARVTL